MQRVYQRMEGPGVMSDEKDVFEQYLQQKAREEGIIMSFDDAEWQLKKVNTELVQLKKTSGFHGRELKKVNREINDLREIVTALQQGESLTEALGAVEERGVIQTGMTDEVWWSERDRIYLEGAPLIDHLLKNDFWEDIDPDEWGVIYAPRKEAVSRLNLSELGEEPDDFVKLLEKHPYVDTVQTHEFGCVTVVTFHALGNTNDWHYKFDIYPGPTTHYVACRWTDEVYSG